MFLLKYQVTFNNLLISLLVFYFFVFFLNTEYKAVYFKWVMILQIDSSNQKLIQNAVAKTDHRI